MHRLRQRKPRHLIVQLVVHPQKRAVIPPFEVWLGDDVADDFVLGFVADQEEVFGVDDQGVFAEIGED